MLSEMDLKKKEGELILQWLDKDDYLVVLDERGKQLHRKDWRNLYRQEPMKVQKRSSS